MNPADARRWDRLGIAIPDILLPKEDLLDGNWPVVACDQHVSDRGYWRRRSRAVGGGPSTLEMVVPECELPIADPGLRAEVAAEAMRARLREGVFREAGRSLVLVRRILPGGAVRDAVLALVDLDRCLDPRRGRGLVRATEAVVEERMPVRLAVRERAPLEIPHLQVVFDDPGLSAVESIGADELEPSPLYDLDLPEGGGRVRAHRLRDGRRLLAAFERLAEGRDLEGGGLWAVGDGNHSFRAAVEHWRRLRSSGAPAAHPARWALCELLNLRSPGLGIHPVHRIVGGPGADLFRERIASVLGEDPRGALRMARGGEVVRLGRPGTSVTEIVKQIEEIADSCPEAELDYEHGEAEALEAARCGGVALLVPPLDPGSILPAAQGGPLPRKTFALGRPMEKRHYLEARRIR